MAHVGEELALGQVGSLGGEFGVLQVFCALFVLQGVGDSLADDLQHR